MIKRDKKKGDIMVVIYYGDLVDVIEPGELRIRKSSYIVAVAGQIQGIYAELPMKYRDLSMKDYGGKLILPSFTDLHLHAVQFANIGLGMDMELLPWLKTYTYPEEKKFEDLSYARAVFEDFITKLWEVGSLRSCIYSSLHEEATLLLFQMMDQAGLSAYIGKVCMDRNGFSGLEETSEDSLAATRRIAERVQGFSDRLQLIITPRFIPSCTNELLEGLGEIARESDLAVQSHLNENLREIEWVQELVPEAKSYLDAYRIRGLIQPNRTIMAHAIYNTQEEIEEIIAEEIFLAHCPSSNLNLSSGIMQAKKLQSAGARIGLGSDIAAGNSMNLADVMVNAIQCSKLLSRQFGEENLLSIADAFYMATRGSGSFFGDSGSFEPGYSMDALIVDGGSGTPEEKLQRFIYSGDTKRIIRRILQGRELPKPCFSQ